MIKKNADNNSLSSIYYYYKPVTDKMFDEMRDEMRNKKSEDCGGASE